MSDESARAVWAMVREQFRLAEQTAAMTAQALVPHAQKKCRLETGRQVHARFDYA